MGFPGGTSGKNLPANAGDIRDAGSIPVSGRSPGGGHDNPLQYSCLENPMDRRAWRAMVYRVTESRTRLKGLSTHSYISQHALSYSFQVCSSMVSSTFTLLCNHHHHPFPEFFSFSQTETLYPLSNSSPFLPTPTPLPRLGNHLYTFCLYGFGYSRYFI